MICARRATLTVENMNMQLARNGGTENCQATEAIASRTLAKRDIRDTIVSVRDSPRREGRFKYLMRARAFRPNISLARVMHSYPAYPARSAKRDRISIMPRISEVVVGEESLRFQAGHCCLRRVFPPTRPSISPSFSLVPRAPFARALPFAFFVSSLSPPVS